MQPQEFVNTLEAGNGVVRHSFWLPSGQERLPAWVHAPGSQKLITGGVVLCAPVGYEYVHSYRSFLHLADALAAAGLVTVRFDYSGTGSASGDAFDVDPLTRWLRNIRDVVAFLNRLVGVDRSSLVGLGIGATLAAVATAGAEVDSLVLWAPIEHGRKYIRERRLLVGVTERDPGQEDFLDAGGFVLSAEAAHRIAAIDLSRLDYSSLQSGVLLVEREDSATSASLQAVLSAQHVDWDGINPGGYLEMIAEPQYTVVPEEAIQGIVQWLQGRQARKVRTPPPNLNWPLLLSTSHADPGGATEELVLIPGESRLSGVLTTPGDRPAAGVPIVVFSNAGTVHQVGPNRIYVELSRALAEQGIASLRVDLRDLGDSITDLAVAENHPYPTTATSDIATVLNWLRVRGFAMTVLGGLCSGAHHAFRAGLALADQAPRGLLLINPLTFRWSEGETLDTPHSYGVATEAGYYRLAVRDPAKWRSLLTGRSDLLRVMGFLVRRSLDVLKRQGDNLLRRTGLKGPTSLDGELQSLGDRRIFVDFIFSDSDPGLDILDHEAPLAVERLKRGRLLTVTTIRDADHTFSKFPARRDFVMTAAAILNDRIRGTNP